MSEERISECQGCGEIEPWDNKNYSEGDTGEFFCKSFKAEGLDKAVNTDD